MTKILTVDDSRAVRTIIAKTLKSKFEIVEAEDGEKGLEKLASEPDVDLVLLDVTMPNMDDQKCSSTCGKVATKHRSSFLRRSPRPPSSAG